MHVIVIGGNGFIGRHFVRQMLAHGARVTIVSRSKIAEPPAGCEALSGGVEALCLRPDLLEHADAVCHLASSSIPSTSSEAPLADVDENLRPMLSLLDIMKEYGNKRILYLSSGGAVYGLPQQVPIPESHPTDPISPYGIVKLAIEKYLAFYARHHGFSPVVIRPANPYGPGQGKVGQLGVIWTFLSLMREGKTATLWGDGTAMRDFVYVEDLCEMMRLALEKGATGVFNCGAGEGTSLNEVIAALETETGLTLDVIRKPARDFDPPRIVLDITRAHQELGWGPKVALQTGIGKTLSGL